MWPSGPAYHVGSYALQVLLLQKQFQDQEAASIVLPTELIIRESCGARLVRES